MSREKTESAGAAARLEVEPEANAGLQRGGGEMGALIRSFDWSKTALGPSASWPQSLRTSVSTCLNCAFPILLWWGPELVMIYNDEYGLILGNKHPGALGQAGASCWPEIWDVIGPMLRQVMIAGEAARARDLLLFLERNGYPEECYFSFSYSPISDESGGIGGVFTPVIETTEKVIGERRLRTLKDLAAHRAALGGAEAACLRAAKTLAENPHDIPFALLYVIDEDRSVARLIATAGISSGGSASPESVPLDRDGEADPWPLAAVARSGETVVVGLNQRLENSSLPCGAWQTPPSSAMVLPVSLPGQQRPAALLVAAISPRKALDAGYRGFMELVADQVAAGVTEAIAYEEERKRAEALAQIDRAKTAFFSNVSHEFRTPLTLMLGPLEDALADAALPALERERVELAHRNSLRLLKLVNSLLDFSRMEAGRAQASYEPVDLAELTTDLASNFRSACQRAGLELVIDCPPLPEPVHVDRQMWENIVLNLVSNAFKFTFEGRILVRLRAVAGHAELTIGDTGVGVPEKELPRLFERFYRVEGQRSRTHEGSGIGLALVQGLVTIHGGAVRVASTPGEGSTFTVEIPFGTAHLSPARIAAERRPASKSIRPEAYVEEALRWLPDQGMAAAELTGDLAERDDFVPLPQDARILIADDNADIRAYLRRLLASRCLVQTVGDGEAALQAIRERRPDLVLTDVMMPRLDGIGLLRAIRGDAGMRDLPVVMLSARAGEESRIEGLNAGADDYLVKPFSARELLARIGAALTMARLRQQAAEALRISEERLQLALDASQIVGAWDWDIPNDRVFADPRFARLYGVEPERAAQGAPIADFIANMHPEDRERTQQVVASAVEASGDFAAEYRVVQPDGSVRWVLAKGHCYHDRHGHPARFSGVSIDITERKRAEASKEAQRRALLGQRRILELVATGAPLQAALDELMRFLEAQEPGARFGLLILGEDGQHFRRGSGPSLPEHYHQALDGAPVTPPYVGSCGEAAHQCEPVVVPDIRGDARYAPQWRELLLSCGLLAVASTPVCGSGGRALGSLAIYYDHPRDPAPANPDLIELGTHLAAIALERAEAERALRHGREQLETLVNESPLGAYLIDADFRFCQINPTASRVFGGIPGLVGRYLDEVMHILWPKSDADEIVARFRHTLETGEPWHAPEFTQKRLDRGVTEYYDWRIHRIPLPSGRNGVVCYFHDISSQVQARQSLEDADRQKDEFLAMLAHELRNPLAPINNASEILSRLLADDARPAAAVAMIKRQAAQLTRLVDDLLDLSRITQRRIELERRPVDLASVVAQAIETAEPQLRARQHRLSTHAESYEPLYVSGDHARLVQCVANILTNAIKYTDAGGEIRIKTHAEGGAAVIEIADNGTGIAPELLPRIFDLFVQSERTLDRAQGGLGIGLCVVKRLVQMHGGEVTARSLGQGSGSTFELRLPRIPRPQPAAIEAGQLKAAPRRVLIVDDNQDAANSLAALLTLQGHETKVAFSGPAALGDVESFHPDVALLDLGLPQMDGYELAARLRAMPGLNDICLVALTGYGQAEDRQRTQAAGFDDHLVKPVELPALERTLSGTEDRSRRA